MLLEDSDAALTNSMFWGAFTVGRVFGVRQGGRDWVERVRQGDEDRVTASESG